MLHSVVAITQRLATVKVHYDRKKVDFERIYLKFVVKGSLLRSGNYRNAQKASQVNKLWTFT